MPRQYEREKEACLLCEGGDLIAVGPLKEIYMHTRRRSESRPDISGSRSKSRRPRSRSLRIASSVERDKELANWMTDRVGKVQLAKLSKSLWHLDSALTLNDEV